MPQVTQATFDAVNANGIAYKINGDSEQILEITVPGAIDIEFTEGGDVEYAIIDGAGPGGTVRYGGGGGGSSGDFQSGIFTVTATTYGMTVGAGGPPPQSDTDYSAGTASSGFGLTGVGGGYGGGEASNHVVPVDGGGGVGRNTGDGDIGATHPTSFSGGDGIGGGINSERVGGGGRGFSGDGQDGLRDDGTSGKGGPGVFSSITGVSIEYCRGGDAGYSANNRSGVEGSTSGSGGEGGGSDGGTVVFGGAGGSGAIILRFALPTSTTVSTGDEVQYTYTVPDTAGTSRTWITASVTVS